MITTFTATVSATSPINAVSRVSGRLPLGFTVTGRANVRSERHLLWDVEVEAQDGADVNDCWVQLTSYGISPSAELGSVWESTLGASA